MAITLSNPTQRFQASSKHLVNHFGTNVTYSKLSTPVFNDDTGELEMSGVNYTVKAFSAKATDDEMADPSLVGREVKVYLIAGADLTFYPNPQDEISITYLGKLTVATIRKVIPHWAGDKVSLWRLICTED